MKTVSIKTKTAKGEVRTVYSDDPFHYLGMWQSSLLLPATHILAAIKAVNSPSGDWAPLMVADALYSKTYEEAGEAHLKLCERIK